MTKTKSLKIEIDPAILDWAIKSSGWKKDELISSLKVSEKTFNGWLDSSTKLSIRQLEDLANKTKRPLASFFLPKPPIEKPLPKDYRMLPNREGEFTKKTTFAIRRIRMLQTLSKELLVNINESSKVKLKKVKTSENPKKIASYYRKNIFKLTEERQRKLREYELYNFLRDKIEDLNIIPFQISMPLEDARGFALVDDTPKIVVVNSKDDIRPRIFSLMHEFGHILLNESAIDLPDESLKTQNKIERWCNVFASEFLFPEDLAKKVFSENKANLTKTNILKTLSNRFGISKATLIYKMLNLNYISKKECEEILRRPRKIKEKKKSKGGGIPADRKCLSEMGNKFVSLVANNYDKKHITYSDALSYLSIKTKKFEKVLSKARK
jgi:Zn-dependent peptidase ImmA (M78 family)